MMNKDLIAILIRDMAHEFAVKRANPYTYATQRYAWMTPEDVMAKVAQVEQRVEYAEAIHQLSSTIADLIAVELNAKVSEDSLSSGKCAGCGQNWYTCLCSHDDDD